MTDLLSQIEAAAALGEKATKRPWRSDYPQSLTGPTCPTHEDPFCGHEWPHCNIVKDSECVAIIAGSAGGMVGRGAVAINDPHDTAAYIVSAANLPLAAIAEELRTYRTVTAALILVMRSVAARARESSNGTGRYSMAGVWEDLAPAAENAEAALAAKESAND